MRRWTVLVAVAESLLRFASLVVETRTVSVMVELSATEGSTFTMKVKLPLDAPPAKTAAVEQRSTPAIVAVALAALPPPPVKVTVGTEV